MSKHTPVPEFDVLPCLVFTCLKCGATIEILQWGISVVRLSGYCHQCKASYHADFAPEIKHSKIVLVETEESEIITS